MNCSAKTMNMTALQITRVAMLASLLYVSKFALDAIPNVELVSMMVIIYTLLLGKETYMIVTVFNMYQVMQWGFGIWTISYFYVWPILVTLTLFFKRFLKEDFTLWSIFSGVFGLIFGALFSVLFIVIDPSYALTYWITGLPWDVIHCIGNFALMFAIGKPVYEKMKYFGRDFLLK